MSGIGAFQKRITGTHQQRIAWSSKDIARIAAHYGVDASTVPSIMRAPLQAPTFDLHSCKAGSAGSADTGTFTFRASDGGEDRMADKIAPEGWSLEAFRKNPVALFAHDGGALPVGKAVSVGVQNNQLMVSIRFAPTGLGRSVAQMIRGGFLNAVSVGFAPIAFSFATEASRKGGIDFHKQELLEISIVPIPANPRALLQSISNGDGKSVDLKTERRRSVASMKAAAKRKRELDVIRLRLPPAPARPMTKAERADEVRAIKARTR